MEYFYAHKVKANPSYLPDFHSSKGKKSWKSQLWMMNPLFLQKNWGLNIKEKRAFISARGFVQPPDKLPLRYCAFGDTRTRPWRMLAAAFLCRLRLLHQSQRLQVELPGRRPPLPLRPPRQVRGPFPCSRVPAALLSPASLLHTCNIRWGLTSNRLSLEGLLSPSA